MQTTTLFKLSAGAAIVAGVLRVTSSFVGGRLGSGAAELLYLVIDVGLVFAILGVYLSRHRQLGVPGLIGFALALCGAAAIVGPDGSLLGIEMYRLGGGTLMLGLGLLAATQLKLRSQRVTSSVSWLLALLTSIVASTSTAAWPFTVVGVFFGLGFIAAGYELIRETRQAPATL